MKSTCDSASRAGNELTCVPGGRGLTEFQKAHEAHVSTAKIPTSRARRANRESESPAIRALRLCRFDGGAHFHPASLERSRITQEARAPVGQGALQRGIGML